MDTRNSAHIVKRFDMELENVRSQVLQMGGLVEVHLGKALNALDECSPSLAQEVINQDYKINDMEIAIDEECTRILALRQPTAGDLRLVLLTTKIISDLERIGDEAERLARFVERMAQKQCDRRYYVEIHHLGELVRGMLHLALDSFARMDVDAAMSVLRQDRKVDAEYEAITRQTMTFMMEDPRAIPLFLDATWCARSLERIGDRSTNIAEYVIYLVKGKNVRHSSLDEAEEAVR